MNYVGPIRAYTETPEERAERLLDEQHEARREECREEFEEWVRAGEDPNGRYWNQREDADFSAWLISRAQPHMVDNQRYFEALDWAERKLMERAA